MPFFLRVRPLLFIVMICAAGSLVAVPRAQPQQGAAPAVSVKQGRIPLTVERYLPGAPVTLGVPFPKGALESPDHVRVLRPDGTEQPSQVTEVTTWDPIDPSLKWVWVFFFAEVGPAYSLEYGPAVRRQSVTSRLEFVNNPRAQGLAEITTGPLRFVVRQGDTGFLSSVQLDLAGDGYSDADVIATGPVGRGSFADVLDDAGVDSSRAVVLRTVMDKGSGPLHAILRVEGEYRYGRADNQASPFVTRIHAYAGKPYIRVLHTWIYTGTPDKHRPQAGDYPHVATQGATLITTDPTDTGWTMPNDRLHGLGLSLALPLTARAQTRFGLRNGSWWSPGDRRVALVPPGPASLVQLGPKPDRIPPVPNSSATTRLGPTEGFEATVTSGVRLVDRAERADGWIDVFDGTRGVAIGIKHLVEEYPKALTFDAAAGTVSAFFWAPEAGPMSFVRASNAPANENAVENWAQGLAKTSEVLLFFHGSQTTVDEVAATMQLVLAPPVAHVAPKWYGTSDVYGAMAPQSARHGDLQRSLDYKFSWMRFNQAWEPWFGMFEHGDMMNTFDGQRWSVFGNGEPAQDFMWWLQFMRSGDADTFDTAMAFSRHTMDVDNTHWPTGPQFLGDTNYPMDYWSTLTTPTTPPASKYLGVGRRHADQHWMHILSAHVWVQGWMASYYLAGEQRGLDVARLTADMHLRRLWGEHELTGRRLYLSIWNLAEVWDATKDVRYERELDDRVGRMLALQRDQADSLVLERYGYTNVYASHGLAKYLSMTGAPAVRSALIRHARAVRDMPPLNHVMESYLSSIHSLALGYRLTGDRSFANEMVRRLDPLKVGPLPRPIDSRWTQSELFSALEQADHFPEDPNRFRPNASNQDTTAPPSRRPIWSFTNGLRVFGWTSAYTVPWAIQVLEEVQGPESRAQGPKREPKREKEQ